jgi:chromosome segregation ATPase
MEEITSEVSRIQQTLHSSRSQLQVLETSAKNAISSEVDGIRFSLKNGDSRVEHVTTQVRSFLSQIEYVNDSTSVDLKPQMIWLRDNLQVIVSDLDAAKAKADSSIECTEKYSYKVMDVGEEVDSASYKLTEYHEEAAKLEEQAKSSLSSSQSMLEHAQSQIKRKEQEIKEKTAEAASKRQRKKQLEADLQNKREQIARAERERKDRKEQAIASAVCS